MTSAPTPHGTAGIARATPNHPMLVGCSGWNYPDWTGPFYPDGLPNSDQLRYYADRFPGVEIDSTFYRCPSKATVTRWAEQTPRDFKICPKVPRSITHDKKLINCEAEVDDFIAAIEPLGAKLGMALLQCGYFNRAAFAGLDDFLSALDAFLAHWRPRDRLPIALEIRNARWVGPALVEVLQDHDATLALTEQQWMPHPAEVLERIGPDPHALPGPAAFVRLLGNREEIERITQRWDRIVIDRTATLERTAAVVARLAQTRPVYVFANNHYAGHSPDTVRQLRKMLAIPDPVPPERPRTTLFD